METVRCDICGADDPQTLLEGTRWRQSLPPGLALVRCQRCGLMFLSPRPTAQEVGAYYPQDYGPFRSAVEDETLAMMRWMRRRKLIQRRKLIEKYSALKQGYILDVGSATGLFLNEMALSGWKTVGLEPSASAVEYARARFALKIIHGTLASADLLPETLDAVTYWDVLEHTFSPSAELARVSMLLKPNGIVAINVPNWNSLDRKLFGPYWIGLDPPRHLYVFTRNTLTALLHKAGFRVLDWICFMPSYFSFIISVERWLGATHPKILRLTGTILNFPGVRLLFEPWFSVMNVLRLGGVITVVAHKCRESEI